ncbi:efflux RND transporter periplasmic adaptor subunit [Sphingobium sp. EM0848]|uniref:efflux RND transporter periplasmic adaptor subunit n=1 Tax=Sphingobium sp. EM0848 TaxID=2743473 RepID=UPI00159C929B|nr:efflux RND transporter periplasmic adaptor subunit [Sphingobium sp. EM0848]
MNETIDDVNMPEGRRLTSRTQLRILGIAAGGFAAVLTIISFAGPLLHRAPAAEPVTPPGTFRPTHDQLAAMTIQTVGMGDLANLTSATGTITADGDLSTPVLMPYAGQVVRVLVDAGQYVTKNQPLLIVKTTDFVDARNALFSARSALMTAQSQVASAKRNADRQRQIYETAGGALKDYQQSTTDLISAQAQERTAEAALGAARDKLAILGKSPTEIGRLESVREVSGLHEQTTLHAPIAGLIAGRDVSPGQYVAAGGDKPVFTITDPSRVWLVAQIAEGDAASVHVGDLVDVTTPAFPGRIFKATVDTVGAALDPATHRLPVRATVPNPGAVLKPQMFASFAIRGKTVHPAIHVPAVAVIHEGETARVWVLRGDGLLAARPVRTGDEQNGSVEIMSGLKTGERIVTAGAIFVNEAGLGQ